MGGEAPPRCKLQFTRQRRLSVYPDEFGMEQDICDVTIWITTKFRVRFVHLWIDRHYTHQGRQIASVQAMTWNEGPDRLTPHAIDAFMALGYEIDDTGADTYAHQNCDGRHSQHEVLQAYDRIEGALEKWCRKQPNHL